MARGAARVQRSQPARQHSSPRDFQLTRTPLDRPPALELERGLAGKRVAHVVVGDNGDGDPPLRPVRDRARLLATLLDYGGECTGDRRSELFQE